MINLLQTINSTILLLKFDRLQNHKHILRNSYYVNYLNILSIINNCIKTKKAQEYEIGKILFYLTEYQLNSAIYCLGKKF